MIKEQADRVVTIKKKMTEIKRLIDCLDFQERFSQPTKLSLGSVVMFFSEIFGSKPSTHTIVDGDETKAIIKFLQNRRKEQLETLEKELEEI